MYVRNKMVKVAQIKTGISQNELDPSSTSPMNNSLHCHVAHINHDEHIERLRSQRHKNKYEFRYRLAWIVNRNSQTKSFPRETRDDAKRNNSHMHHNQRSNVIRLKSRDGDVCIALVQFAWTAVANEY